MKKEKILEILLTIAGWIFIIAGIGMVVTGIAGWLFVNAILNELCFMFMMIVLAMLLIGGIPIIVITVLGY